MKDNRQDYVVKEIWEDGSETYFISREHQKEDAMRDIKNASWKKAHCKAKMEVANKAKIALAKGKKSHDQRATIKDREWQREKSRVMKKTLF